ncbi:hypothetical protein D3C85_1454280 [compost metagenome]
MGNEILRVRKFRSKAPHGQGDKQLACQIHKENQPEGIKKYPVPVVLARSWGWDMHEQFLISSG